MKKFLHALAIGAASIGGASLAEFGLGKVKSDAPRAAKVAAKLGGAALGAGVSMAILK